MFRIFYTQDCLEQIKELKEDKGLAKRYKAVKKSIKLLEFNPRHPSLNTHKYDSLSGPNGEDVFEAYAEQKTPAAYRIFWHYGPDKSCITIFAVTSHP